MTGNVTSPNGVPDPTYGSAPSATPHPPTPLPAAADTSQAAVTPSSDLRLVIEDDQKAGCFVYKTIDWRTGEVVQQIPREQIVKLREDENYSAGAVFSTSA